MPIESRSNSALFRRAEQLKRWEDSETNNVPATASKDKKSKIKFSDGCVFLAACAASDTEEVERLLNEGTDINTANVDGLTALHQACIDNNLEMVQFLCSHGCDLDRGDNEGWTPLHATASCGFLSIAQYLVEHGANVAAVNNDGDLPIDIAESNEMEDYLSDALDAQGIDCDEARSKEELIMLEDAKLMAANSIDMNEKVHPRTFATPLHVASAKGYIEVMKLLIKGGGDLNAQDYDGWTPLHAAAHWCQKEACAILADNLANMDIQNFAGQTCFDVADPDVVKLLEELKKKQASIQKDRPEIQAILQRTSNRPPLKRRTSVTRMSGQEKSKSVMKDTKAERAQIESLTLPEEDNEEDKDKIQKKSIICDMAESPVKQEPAAPESIPSWKKMLRRSTLEANPDSIESEVILKRPKKLNDDNKEKEEDVVNKEGRPSIPPVRDDESELQRKAHAKRVRETRRSTQGVLLEDIKSAELQFLINTQQEAAKRQADEIHSEPIEVDSNKSEVSSDVPDHSLSMSSKEHISQESSVADASQTSLAQRSASDVLEKQNLESRVSNINSPVPSENISVTQTENSPSTTLNESLSSVPSPTESPPSVTLTMKSKSITSPEDTSPSDSKASLGTQAAIQRRRRPKRRSTGVVYLDSDDAPEEKENISDKESNPAIEHSPSERSRQRYGSSSSIPDSASDVSARGDSSSRPWSRHTLSEDEKDYKKLYEDVKKENEKLKETLRKTEDELERTKKQLQKSNQNNTIKNSISEAEKKERRCLERKVSEMEEEIKQCEKLKADNERLKEENAALIRVISKISQ